MKKKICGLLASVLGLTACAGLAGCDLTGMDFEDAYNEALNSVYDTYTQEDGKISLPVNGTRYTYTDNGGREIVVSLDKTEYVTQIINSAGMVYTEIKAYFTVVSGTGDFAIVGKLYDSEGYLLDSYNKYTDSSVTMGDKFALDFYYSLDEMTEAKYLAGGYRFALADYE